MATDRSQSPDRPRRISFLTLVLITAALYFGRDVLIPLALAILISFILAPLVTRLQAIRLGRVPAVLLVVILVFGAVGALGWTMGRQLVSFAETLPRYEQNIRAKTSLLRGGGTAALDQARKTVEHFREDLGVAPPPGSGARAGGEKPRAASAAPVPVTVVEPPESPLTVLRTTLVPLLGPLGTAGLVFIFVIFMLIQREDLRDRLLRLLGQGRLNASTQALDEAAQRVSRYLLMQSLINGGTGIAVGLGLFFIGVPNALLWGLFAAVLRFIPYVGPWVAASLPTLISLAVFPGWEKPLLTLGLFLLIELISNNVVEPLVYGSETGISTLGILVSAVFWTWLWGPVGLLMATPLTVCLVVIGRYVPQLQFLDVLLGDQPPLPLEAQVYHRLLAMDSEEAGALVEGCVQEKNVAELYDGVLIPALILAERDRHRGKLSPEREEFVASTVRDWIDDFAGRTVEDGSLGSEMTAGDRGPAGLRARPGPGGRAGGAHAGAARGTRRPAGGAGVRPAAPGGAEPPGRAGGRAGVRLGAGSVLVHPGARDLPRPAGPLPGDADRGGAVGPPRRGRAVPPAPGLGGGGRGGGDAEGGGAGHPDLAGADLHAAGARPRAGAGVPRRRPAAGRDPAGPGRARASPWRRWRSRCCVRWWRGCAGTSPRAGSPRPGSSRPTTCCAAGWPSSERRRSRPLRGIGRWRSPLPARSRRSAR